MSVRKRTWFTAAELKKIKPRAESLATAAGLIGKNDWLNFRDEAAASLRNQTAGGVGLRLHRSGG